MKTRLLIAAGLSGGIVKLPKGCPKPSEQPMGIGSTVYFFVESIDEVCAPSSQTSKWRW